MLIALFESPNTNLLAFFDNSDKYIKFCKIDNKLALKTAANQAFFKENTLLYSISDFDSDSNSDFDENNSIKCVFQNKDNVL